ncbi:MAG TPA: ADP-ribosylglycohydrolase family protein [Dermatophilaceae bacterium]
MTRRLSTAQLDRAAGVLLGMACGDALGAGYEFGPPLAPHVPVAMTGGRGFEWEPGEWTDDTSMAIAIAEVSATGADLRSDGPRDLIAARWAGWGAKAKDVGNQTRAVLSAATRAARTRGETKPTAADLAAAAEEHHSAAGRSGGNGSLMRTAPIALAYLDDPDALVLAAQEMSAMTHHDPEVGEACALWCLAIRHAVLEGRLDVRSGLEHLPKDRASVWAARLDEAEAGQPSRFDKNGWVVQALQGAWSAINTTVAPVDKDSGSSSAGSSSARPAHFRRALEAAVRGGRDTDTVAAIAGALVGGLYGASAVPAHWRRLLHGWPGLRARDLVRLGVMTARGGKPDPAGWPSGDRMDYSTYKDSNVLAPHPYDDHVWLGGVDALTNLPDGVNAVVSLCRLGKAEVPAPGVAAPDHVEVWLIDETDPAKNPNLDFVLSDAAGAVSELRDEGRTVLLHCVQAQSRTPAVAALYGARLTGRTPTEALADIAAVLRHAHPNAALQAALERLG